MALLNKINVKGTEYPIVTDDGYYQEMSVGGAEQLISTVFVEDEVPYNFRTTGGSADVGNRKTEKLIGGTIAWNQLVPKTAASTAAATNNGDGSFTVAIGASTYYLLGTADIHQGHKYLACGKGGDPSTCYFRIDNNTGNAWVFTSDCTMYEAGFSGTNKNLYIRINNPAQEFTIIPMLFDLTQMFGSTIADAIYALEQSQAGAGVAWFKKLFPKLYYAYDAGELMSVKALRHITRGFNQFDGETELGGINTAGNETTTAGYYRSKNYTKILPNTSYYFKFPVTMAVMYYDINKDFIDWASASGHDAYTTPTNAYYLRFRNGTANTWTPSASDDICINLSWDGERDGEYEEYEEHVYELDPDLELRGIPKLSAGNDLYYDGDVYEPDGTVTRKYEIVDLGTLDYLHYEVDDGKHLFRSSEIADSAITANMGNTGYPIVVCCSKYVAVRNAARDNRTLSCGVNKKVDIIDNNYTTAAAFKTAMSGVYLVYELATPTTEEADPYNGSQIVDDFGTEEFVDAGVVADPPTRDVAIPVGHNSLYQPNLRAKLEMVPESPEDDGYYVVYHHNGINEYVPLIIPQELPDMPTEDGTYILKCTVASGSATLSFESEV